MLARLITRRPSVPPRAPLLIAYGSAALVLVYIGIMGYLAAEPARFVQVVLSGSVWPSIPLMLASAGAAAMAAYGVAAWLRRWWSTAGRIHYTVAALGGLTFLITAFVYGLI